jgi:hypothetical protein
VVEKRKSLKNPYKWDGEHRGALLGAKKKRNLRKFAVEKSQKSVWNAGAET